MLKLILILVTWIAALIPTWVFLLLKTVIAPVGFLQNFLVLGLGIWFLGGLQIVIALLAVALTLKIITEN